MTTNAILNFSTFGAVAAFLTTLCIILVCLL